MLRAERADGPAGDLPLDVCRIDLQAEAATPPIHFAESARDPVGTTQQSNVITVVSPLGRPFVALAIVVACLTVVELHVVRSKEKEGAAGRFFAGSTTQVVLAFWSVVMVASILAMVRTLEVKVDMLRHVTWTSYRMGFFVAQRRTMPLTAVRRVVARANMGPWHAAAVALAPDSALLLDEIGSGAAGASKSGAARFRSSLPMKNSTRVGIALAVRNFHDPPLGPPELLVVDVVAPSQVRDVAQRWAGLFQRLGAACTVDAASIDEVCL